jgi:hypothetical protein
MTKKSLLDRDNTELWILTPKEEAEIAEVLAWDESITEAEDLFRTEQFKKLSRWKRFYLRLRVALLTFLQML